MEVSSSYGLVIPLKPTNYDGLKFYGSDMSQISAESD